MGTQQWPKVRTRTTKVKGRRYSYWEVDCGVIDGSRKTFSFKTEQEATKKAEELRTERNRIGKDASQLSDEKKREAVRAYQLLNGSGSLIEAAKFYLAHTTPGGGQATVQELLNTFIEVKTKAGRRPATIETLKVRIGRFAKDFGSTPAHTMTTRDLEKWFDAYNITGTNRDNYRRALVGFFEFAKKRKYTRSNPASELEKPILDDNLPEILTVEEVKRLMESAQKHRPDMVSYFALCIFAGLRPAEANGFDINQIDFDAKLISVRPAVAKKRRQRFVDLQDNLGEWLLPYKTELAHFSRRGLLLVRDKAAVAWAHDIMRHSYASYHLAKFEDAAKTSLQMGHLRPDVLFNHYRNMVRRTDAERFWSIVP